MLLRVRLLPDGEQERNQETQADRQTGTGTDQKIIVNWEFVKTFDSTPSLRLNLSLPLLSQGPLVFASRPHFQEVCHVTALHGQTHPWPSA